MPGVRAELRPVPKFIGVKTPLAVDLRAARGGVASVEIKVVQGATSAVVAQQVFAGAARRPSSTSTSRWRAATSGLREGAATLEVRARDGFWRPFRRGRPPDR